MSPGDGFADRVMKRVSNEAARTAAPARSAWPFRQPLFGWLGLMAVTACLMAGVGVVHWKREALQQERRIAARAQLLQALNIASDQLNRARTRVVGEQELTQ